MNWTEGALARHSRRKGWKEEASRQKQYFAKARARLHQNHSQLPRAIHEFIPNYLQQHTGLHILTSRACSDTQRKRNSRKRLIHALERSGGTTPENRQVNSRADFATIRNGCAPQEILPLPTGPDDLDTKRRRLLDKSDWTGIEVQKPLIVDFTGRHDPELNQSSSHVAHHLRTTHLIRQPRSMQASRPQRMPRPRDLRLRIGTEDFRWSDEGNSIRTTLRSGDSPSRNLASPSIASTHSHILGGLHHHVLDRAYLPLSQDPDPPQPGSTPPTSRYLVANDGHAGGSAQVCQPQPTVEETRFVASELKVIHHPQPLRGGWEKSLLQTRSPDLDVADSLVAQPDSSVHTEPTITRADDEWRKWLYPSRRDEPRSQSQAPSIPAVSSTTDERGNDRYSAEVRMSPSTHPIGTKQDEGCPLEAPAEIRRVPMHSTVQCASSQAALHEPPDPKMSSLQAAIQPRPTAEAVPATQLSGFASLMHNVHNGRGSNPSLHHCNQNVNQRQATTEYSRVPKKPRQNGPSEAEDNYNTNSHGKHDLDRCEDEDALWRKFILDEEGSEMDEAAWAAAHEQTMRELYPAAPELRITGMEQSSFSGGHGKLNCVMDHVEDHDDLFSSLKTTPVSSPTSMAVNPASNLASSGDATNSLVAQQGSTPSPPPAFVQRKAEFKFHQPQLFVGRLANTAPNHPRPNESPPPIPPPPLRGTASKRGRPRRSRKKRERGRPNFRAMPDLVGDPIEDIC